MKTPIARTIEFIEYKIKELKKRRPRLIDDFSKYAMTMSIDELKEIIEYAKAVQFVKGVLTDSEDLLE